MSAIARLMLVVVVLVAGFLTATALNMYIVFLTKDQSEENELHIDCIVALSAETEPPQCVDVWHQLYADGILPTPPTTAP